MIIHDHLEFHAAELLKVPGINGLLPVRIPASIGNTLNERARYVARDTIHSEIRFVTDAPIIHLYLSALEPELGSKLLEVRIMRGNFEQTSLLLPSGTVTRVVLDQPPEFAKTRSEALREGPGIGFSPDVVRIVPGRGGLVYCGIDTFGHAVRPPVPEEKPSIRCLCYGSSITNSMLDGYPFTMSRVLGTDCINLGLSGSCQIQKELIDWIAERSDWDLATLELGINILWMDEEEFMHRVDYALTKILSENPDKNVFLITIFPFAGDEGIARNPDPKAARFREILRSAFRKHGSVHPNLHLIEGKNILTDFTGVYADLVHPRIYAQVLMGLNLAKEIRKQLPELFPEQRSIPE